MCVHHNAAGRVQRHANITVRVWYPLQKAAGLVDVTGLPLFNFHALRHFAASNWIAQGFSAKRLQTLLGHSSVTMTFDRYGHWLPSLEDDHAKFADAEWVGRLTPVLIPWPAGAPIDDRLGRFFTRRSTMTENHSNPPRYVGLLFDHDGMRVRRPDGRKVLVDFLAESDFDEEDALGEILSQRADDHTITTTGEDGTASRARLLLVGDVVSWAIEKGYLEELGTRLSTEDPAGGRADNPGAPASEPT